jgi:hypothetical protein
MVGELNLKVLLSSMTATLVDGIYVFVTLKDRAVPTGLEPRMMFVEAEGITLILRKEQADAASLDYEFPCRMISLEVHSSLEAVGFIARIATELAKADMGVNPVSGFYHDHLFVPDGRQDDALRILQTMANEF